MLLTDEAMPRRFRAVWAWRSIRPMRFLEPARSTTWPEKPPVARTTRRSRLKTGAKPPIEESKRWARRVFRPTGVARHPYWYSQNRLRIGRNRVLSWLVDRGGTRDITRSFNTFSTIQSSIREAHLTRLASGAICVPLCCRNLQRNGSPAVRQQTFTVRLENTIPYVRPYLFRKDQRSD